VTNFHEMYVRHAPDVFRFALYLSGDWHEAEDITSEAFVRAWSGAAPIRTGTAKGYLLTIARNVFLHGVRRRSRNAALDEELHDPRASAERHTEQRSELAEVFARLQRIAEGDRAALLMRAVGEMSYEEIARSLGIAVTAVKARVYRARAAVADLRRE
jgi:RNA polymerase sigma-70 factor (ECF subfamily)